MAQIKTSHKIAGGTAAAVIAGNSHVPPELGRHGQVAKRDMIGTGHPVTYCYGQTDEFGKVKVGTRFNKQQCDEKLAESLPKYLNKVGPCVHAPVPVKSMAAALDASYNAGPAAVCKSPMVAQFNAGNVRAGCEAFNGWYVRSAGQVRKGLIARVPARPLVTLARANALCASKVCVTLRRLVSARRVPAPPKKPSKPAPETLKAVEAPKPAPAKKQFTCAFGTG
jgi:lysozyme